jgi:glycolate oxidase
MFFPVQPASHSVATIGGMVSTNAGGEHVLRYGRMDANIARLTIVTGGGELLEAKGSRLMHFCGTEGLMGVVVEAELKLAPLIKSRSVTVLEAASAGELVEMVQNALKQEKLIACECMNPMVYEMAGFGERYFLLLEYADGSGKIRDRKGVERSWKVREGCYRRLSKRGWTMIADPVLPMRSIEEFLVWCEQNGLPAFGHIGHGVMHVHFRSKKKLAQMYQLVKTLGGSVSGEHGFGVLKRRYLPEARRRELKRLKKVYDSGDILNRGKVL